MDGDVLANQEPFDVLSLLEVLPEGISECDEVSLRCRNLWFANITIDRDEIAPKAGELVVALRRSVDVTLDWLNGIHQRNVQGRTRADGLVDRSLERVKHVVSEHGHQIARIPEGEPVLVAATLEIVAVCIERKHFCFGHNRPILTPESGGDSGFFSLVDDAHDVVAQHLEQRFVDLWRGRLAADRVAELRLIAEKIDSMLERV
ncbi:MAG: hypothetical protein QM736_15115 [Vicinamibacterales bacterium]